MGDILFLVLSLWLALWIRNLEVPALAYFLEHFRAFILVYGVSLLVFYISGLYEKQTRLIKRILGARIAGAQATNTLLAAVFFFILPFAIAPKTILALYLLISVVLVSVWRFFVAPYFSIIERRKGLLIGRGPGVEEVFAQTRQNQKYYIQFIECVDPSRYSPGKLLEVVNDARAKGVSVIVLDTRDEIIRKELDSLYQQMISGLSFVEFSTFYEDLFDKVPLEHVDSNWLLESLPKQNFGYFLAKRILDLSGGILGMVLTAPFVLIAALALACTGGRPFIFHERIGQGGKHFNIIKLRSMLLNDHGDPVLQQKNRVTKIGYLLRRTRIDEFPQLVNILKGELSFIGPRPELPQIAKVYEREIPFYGVRYLIPPGLSGWAQIYDYDAPRGGADVERTKRKLSYDLYYLKNRSFGIDVAIALKTLRAIASFSGK
jgi:lipopolysaccharide/colanic/teichoic acid biosynthesis glycosyltransferase